jgi:predicted ABC-type transport system involved in lysophospholipase L1 biosynthesis ATPase subunit
MSVFFELQNLAIPGLVEQLDLRLDPGMVVQIKTRGEEESRLLLQVITGEKMPESGVVLSDGHALHNLNRDQLLHVRSTIGMVTSRTGLISNLKVWENITLPRLYHQGSVPPHVAEQATQLLEKLGYRSSLWALPGHLSHAERIMVIFVRAVISSPRLMIYADWLNDVSGPLCENLLCQAADVQNQVDAPAALFITAGELHFPSLKADSICDLSHNPPQITRPT